MAIDPREVLIRPVVSEKSVMDNEKGKYVFEVDRRATKVSVRQAVEKLFSVKVTSVNIQNVKGKTRRFRFKQGKTKNRKKAIVTLREGDKIALFD